VAAHRIAELRERFGLPEAAGARRLLWATAIDATGTGLFLPFVILYFVRATSLSAAAVGLR
jgi:hypothetical protein